MGAPIILKDTMPIGTLPLTTEEAEFCKEHRIPLLKGMLFRLDEYGNEIFEKENVVTLGGSLMTLERVFGVPAKYMPPTLNEIFSLNRDLSEKEDPFQSYVKTFCVGTGGSAIDFGNVYDPRPQQKQVLDMVPFRISDSEILEGSESEKYFFRKQISTSPPKWGWYLKEFEKEVEITARWKDAPEPDADGMEITHDVSGELLDVPIEAIGEAKIKISPYDIRDYFHFNGNITMARYNSIGLCTGRKVAITESYSDYVNVRAFTVLNLENVSVKERQEITYLYRVYAMI